MLPSRRIGERMKILLPGWKHILLECWQNRILLLIFYVVSLAVLTKAFTFSIGVLYSRKSAF